MLASGLLFCSLVAAFSVGFWGVKAAWRGLAREQALERLHRLQAPAWEWQSARLLWFQPMDGDRVGLQDLMVIPGVGGRTAQRFISLRSSLGGFLHRDQWTCGMLPYGGDQTRLLGAYLSLDGPDSE